MFAVTVMMNGLSLWPHAWQAGMAWVSLACVAGTIVIGLRSVLGGSSPRVRQIVPALLLAILLSGLYASVSDACLMPLAMWPYSWFSWAFY